jgi:hypothetical protein
MESNNGKLKNESNEDIREHCWFCGNNSHDIYTCTNSIVLFLENNFKQAIRTSNENRDPNIISEFLECLNKVYLKILLQRINKPRDNTRDEMIDLLINYYYKK